ncbi:MAG: hypothetical protein A2138_21045 [Deltaproteobacteria bacterium RBG_16_71_12]|nr:MAG: hypothetical protein A2138_21045 [Deltaproteobacteria bacterium RBG_16_71_12]
MATNCAARPPFGERASSRPWRLPARQRRSCASAEGDRLLSVRTAPLSPRIAQALAEFRRKLEARFGDRLLELRLFGSWARGEANENSDVDVFVLLRTMTQADWRDVVNEAAAVGLELDLAVSPTIFDQARYQEWRRQERGLVMDIQRQGIPV